MALDPDQPLDDQPEAPPRAFTRPAEAPPPLDRLANSAPLEALRNAFHARPAAGTAVRTRARMRNWLGRVSGRSSRRLQRALADATIALADRCDVLADRISAQEGLTEEAVTAFGEEITRLRGEVAHLRRYTSRGEDPGGA